MQICVVVGENLVWFRRWHAALWLLVPIDAINFFFRFRSASFPTTDKKKVYSNSYRASSSIYSGLHRFDGIQSRPPDYQQLVRVRFPSSMSQKRPALAAVFIQV